MSEEESVAEKLEQADIDATMEVAQHHDHPVVETLGFLSEISDQPPAFSAAAFASLAGLLLKRPRLAEAGIRSFVALGVATATKSIIKASVTRTRPFMLRDKGHYDRRSGGPNDGPWNSFPSGHTANAVAAARAITRVYPQAALPVGIAAAGIGAIQVPRGSHFPIDVAAGAVVGFLSEQATDMLWRRVVPARGEAEGEQPASELSDHQG